MESMNKQDREVANDEVGSCDMNDAESCKPKEAPNVNSSVELAGESSAGESVASGFTEMHINSSRTPVVQLCCSMYAPLTVMAMLCCWAVRYFFRVKKQQQEWYESSNKELAKIRQRSFTSTNQTKMLKDPPGSILEGFKPISKYRPSGDVSERSKAFENKDQEYRGPSSSVNHDENILPSAEGNNISDVDIITKSASTDNLASVRARQQEIHDRRNTSAKQQRLQHQKHRQQQLVESLQHDVADKAYQRRKQIISQEQDSIMKLSGPNIVEREQTLLEELQEMERQALLQRQNHEYNESLQQDQERTRIKELKMNEFKRRRKAVRDAKYRLFISGAQLSGILNDFELKTDAASKTDTMREDKSCIQVRLLLPTGQRIQGVFADAHCIGLLYDFALVVLDRESLLWSDESLQNEYDAITDADTLHESDFDCDTSSASFDYASIQSEWEEMFCSFSLVSTYPRKVHDDLSLTLLQSGFVQSTSLMVVIEAE